MLTYSLLNHFHTMKSKFHMFLSIKISLRFRFSILKIFFVGFKHSQKLIRKLDFYFFINCMCSKGILKWLIKVCTDLFLEISVMIFWLKKIAWAINEKLNNLKYLGIKFLRLIFSIQLHFKSTKFENYT